MKFSHHRSQNSPWSWEAEEMFCHWCKLWLHMSLVLRSFFGLTVHLLFYVYVIFPRIKSWAGNVIDLDFTKFHPHQWDKKKIDWERREGRKRRLRKIGARDIVGFKSLGSIDRFMASAETMVALGQWWSPSVPLCKAFIETKYTAASFQENLGTSCMSWVSSPGSSPV